MAQLTHEVETALDGATGWRAELARTLARALDAEPNASMARELRSVMDAIAKDAGARTKGTPLDELAERRAAASG